MRYLIFIIIISFSLQSVNSFYALKEFLFPRHPVLHRVRKSSSPRNFQTPVILDFIGLVEKQGYPGEEHHLTTKDGYKLTIHRIPGSPKSPPAIEKPIVFLQHGFLCSSDFWVIMDAKNSLAFTLADEGYDVWVGNIRGNSYCRSHETLSTLDAEFWNFSYHQMGLYDLPAMIDYCLKVTGEKQIIYVGHSMGTTMSYVLLSMKPSYNQKIKLIVSLAPIAFWKVGPRGFGWHLLQTNFDSLRMFLYANNIYDVLPLTNNMVKLFYEICGSNIISRATCAAIMFIFSGSNPEKFNITLLPQILSQFPAGASVQTMDHYKQNYELGLFQQYDHNCAKNYRKCRKTRLMQYNVKKITSPIALIYSKNDALVGEENVFELMSRLPNVVKLHKILDNNFTHADYLWARDVKVLVNDKILEIISLY